MANGIDFTGNGSDDVSNGPSSTAPFASRGSKGPIDFAGDGGADVGGTIENTSDEGPMPPKGSGVEFAGNGGEDA